MEKKFGMGVNKTKRTEWKCWGLIVLLELFLLSLQGHSKPKPRPAFGQRCPRLRSFRNLFWQKQCKCARKIGVAQIKCPFIAFHRDKVPFLCRCQTLALISKITPA